MNFHNVKEWHRTCLCKSKRRNTPGRTHDMKQLLTIVIFAFATLFAGNALASESASDISWSDKQCCCKAGCPTGWSGYFCRAACTAFGGSCSRSASDFPQGADATLRNSCMGASYHWWYGLQCPASCPSNSGS